VLLALAIECHAAELRLGVAAVVLNRCHVNADTRSAPLCLRAEAFRMERASVHSPTAPGYAASRSPDTTVVTILL